MMAPEGDSTRQHLTASVRGRPALHPLPPRHPLASPHLTRRTSLFACPESRAGRWPPLKEPNHEQSDHAQLGQGPGRDVPKVFMLSLTPIVLKIVLAVALGYFFWGPGRGGHAVVPGWVWLAAAGAAGP